MSQHPRSVPSGSGLAVREGFNNALDSAFTLNSGPVAPASPQAGLLWLDTATGVLKIRNDANTQWVDLADRLGALRHDIAQSLTSDQKQRVQGNIGLGTVAVEDVVPVSKGGTGSSTTDAARTALNAAIRLPAPGAIESMVWAVHLSSDVIYGGSYLGSSLRPTGAASSIYVIGTGFTASASLGGGLSGTWVCLGQGIRNSTTPSTSAVDFAYLFQRIA